MTKQINKCSFCGRSEKEVEILLTGATGFICNDCVERAHEMIEEILKKNKTVNSGLGFTKEDLPRPQEIKRFLDQYVIGQDAAKRYLSVAVFNHYKRLLQNADSKKDDVEIEKSNIIMVGHTGTGKTLLAKTIARMLNVPFTIVDATVLTEAGYVGEDIESILTRLLQVADYNVEAAERGIVFIDEIDKIARKGDNQKMIAVNTKNILYICGGAFDGIEKKIALRLNTQVVGYGADKKRQEIDRNNMLQYISPQDLKSFGLIPEIIGRLPLLTYLDPLDKDALRRILTEPKNSIIKQYVRLFEMDDVTLTFDDDVLDYIVEKAIEFKLGARGLRSIAETIMMDAMFDMPSSDEKTLHITRKYAEEKLKKANMHALH